RHHTGQSSDLATQVCAPGGTPPRSVRVRLRQLDAQRDNVRCVEPWRNLVHPPDTREKEPGADEHHHGEGDFDSYEQALDPPGATSRAATRSAALAQQFGGS